MNQATEALEYIRANRLEQLYKGDRHGVAQLVAMQQKNDVRFLTPEELAGVEEVLDFLELCYQA
jgi:hypothetical protein